MVDPDTSKLLFEKKKSANFGWIHSYVKIPGLLGNTNIYPPSDSSVLVRNQSVLLLPPSRPKNWVPPNVTGQGNWGEMFRGFLFSTKKYPGFQPMNHQPTRICSTYVFKIWLIGVSIFNLCSTCNVPMYVESVYNISLYAYIIFISIHPIYSPTLF